MPPGGTSSEYSRPAGKTIPALTRDVNVPLTRGAYDRAMAANRTSGPDPDEITLWIITAYPDTVVSRAMHATFFSLTEQAWPNFATIVTTDEHDVGTPSNLARNGAFRLNIGVGKEAFERVVGRAVATDYSLLDVVLPHPVYAKQRWLCVLNPNRQTFDQIVKPLIAEAHARLAAPTAR